MCVLVTFSVLGQNAWLSNRREEGIILAPSERGSPSWSSRMVAGTKGSRSHGICSQGADRDERWCSAHPLLHIQSGTPAYELVQATFRAGLPSSGKPFWKHPHRHIERSVSIATANPFSSSSSSFFSSPPLPLHLSLLSPSSLPLILPHHPSPLLFSVTRISTGDGIEVAGYPARGGYLSPSFPRKPSMAQWLNLYP